MAFSYNGSEIVLPSEVKEGLIRVHSSISSFAVSDFVDKSLFSPSVALLGRRGKLLRPTLVLMGAHAYSRDPLEFVDLAVAAELLHTASLIHDDIIDGDVVRRRSFSVHAKYGNHVALLAGDALISKAVGIAAKYGEPVLKSITGASMDMCAGEVIDYNYQRLGRIPGVKEYIRIASLKSASLIGVCCNAAAVYSGSRDAEAVYAAGRDLGIAFQIRDDIMDFVESGRGKPRKPTPNMISSIKKDYGLGEKAALARAVEANNDYVGRARRRLSGMKAEDAFFDYIGLISVSL